MLRVCTDFVVATFMVQGYLIQREKGKINIEGEKSEKESKIKHTAMTTRFGTLAEKEKRTG